MKLLRYGFAPLAVGLAFLSPARATAQQPPALAGLYMACFRAADSTRPACGTLTLAPTTSCSSTDASPVYDGYYSVLFSALRLRDSAGTRPANEQRFTWEARPDSTV